MIVTFTKSQPFILHSDQKTHFYAIDMYFIDVLIANFCLHLSREDWLLLKDKIPTFYPIHIEPEDSDENSNFDIKNNNLVAMYSEEYDSFRAFLKLNYMDLYSKITATDFMANAILLNFSCNQ